MNISRKSSMETHALHLAESLRSRSTFQVVLECLIHASISSTALLGNIFVLYVVYKSPRLRNVTGLFVVSLAMSDIAMATLVTPQSFCSTHRKPLDYWVHCMSASGLCRHSNGSRLAADHVPNVYRPIFPRCPSNETSKFLCYAPCPGHGRVGLDLVSDVSGPIASGRTYIFHPGKSFCFHEAESTFEADVIYICLCISLAVLSFCYLNIFRHLRLNAKRVKNMRGTHVTTDDNTRHISPEEIRLTRTLFVTVLGYLICWTPVVIIDFVEMGVGDWSLSRGVYFFYTNIGLISSSLSPIIYEVLNRTFRREYRRIFCFKKQLSNQDES